MNARKEWARGLIRRFPNPPAYGSREWLNLPDSHPAKVAAAVVAAECWARDGDNLPERLRLEVLALSRANKRADDAEWVSRDRSALAPRASASEIEAEFWDWVRGDVA